MRHQRIVPWGVRETHSLRTFLGLLFVRPGANLNLDGCNRDNRVCFLHGLRAAFRQSNVVEEPLLGQRGEIFELPFEGPLRAIDASDLEEINLFLATERVYTSLYTGAKSFGPTTELSDRRV